MTQLYVPAVSHSDATDQAARLESREQREEFAELLASKIVAAQQGAASAAAVAATAPITRAAFDKLPVAEKMTVARSGRRIID